MIRKNNKGSRHAVYDPAENRWICRVVIEGARRAFAGHTEKEALQKMEETIATAGLGVYNDPSLHTVATWSDFWLENYCMSQKPKTLLRYRSDFKNHINPAIGKIRIQQLDTAILQAFIRKISEKLSAKSVKNCFSTLKACLRQAVLCDYIRKNPCDGCKLPACPRYSEIPPTVPTPQQAGELVKAIADSRYRNALVFDMLTGMREGEILGLSWNDVDFDKGCITVRQQLSYASGKYTIATTKTDNVRKIYPAQSAMGVLQTVKQEQMANRVKCLSAGIPWQNQKYNLVFTKEDGSHLGVNCLYKCLKGYASKIGLETMRFHDLRHFCATQIYEQTGDLKLTAEVLGHTQLQTTQRYAHPSESRHREAAAKMDALFTAEVL